MPTRGVIAIVMTITVSGCASLASVTSGHIGCPEHEISIFNQRQHWNSRSWSARCRGRVYHCIGMGGGKYSAPHISCKREPGSTPSLSASVSRGPTRAGCQYDNQCKGDRICMEGRCVAPQPRSSGGSTKARPGPSPRTTTPVSPPVAVKFEKRMGIKVGDTAKHAAAMGLKASRGAVILSVQRGSAAHRRNLRRGDVIVGLATSRVKSVADLTRLGQPLKPGQRFHIIVQRKGRIFSFYMRF